jgi:hypothetical protein
MHATLCTVVIRNHQESSQGETIMFPVRAQLLLAAALSCGVALTGVPSVGAAPGVLLRYHFVAGQQTTQKLVMNLAGSVPVMAPKLALAEVVPFTQTVKQTYADGSALVVDTFTAATVTTNGQSTTTPLTGASVTERLTPLGQVISSKAVGLQSLTGGVLNIDPSAGIPTLPASAVTVGSHWTAAKSISLGSFGTLHGPLHYTVTAMTRVNGHLVATIQEKGSWPLSVSQGLTQVTGTATGTGSVQFDTDAGALLSTQTVMKVSASFGQGAVGSSQAMPINLTLHLNVNRAQ